MCKHSPILYKELSILNMLFSHGWPFNKNLLCPFFLCLLTHVGALVIDTRFWHKSRTRISCISLQSDQTVCSMLSQVAFPPLYPQNWKWTGPDSKQYKFITEIEGEKRSSICSYKGLPENLICQIICPLTLLSQICFFLFSSPFLG